MKKVIKINEDTFNRLFNSTINEISHDTVDRAYNKSDDIFYNLTNAFNDFYDELKYNADTNNPYIQKIKAYADAIGSILSVKVAQKNKFSDELNKFDHTKFYNDESRPEDEEDYGNLDLKYLQYKYPKQ